MIKPFKIYLKNGTVISLKIHSFEIKEQNFVLYEAYEFEIKNLFILFDEVSAIVPNEIDTSGETRRFNVYLRNIKEPVEVWAYEFSSNNSQTITFFDKNYSNQKVETENLYISSPEIIAILPADKLEIQ